MRDERQDPSRARGVRTPHQELLRGLPALIGLCALSACHPTYVEPPPSAPHAVLKVRSVHQSWPGPNLSHVVLLDDERVGEARQPVKDAPLTFPVRIHLKPVRMEVTSSFTHTIMVNQTRTESYPCGTQTCTRTVNSLVPQTVSDGSCSARMPLVPREAATYIAEYDFFEAGKCSLRCLEQQPDGGLSPCK